MHCGTAANLSRSSSLSSAHSTLPLHTRAQMRLHITTSSPVHGSSSACCATGASACTPTTARADAARRPAARRRTVASAWNAAMNWAVSSPEVVIRVRAAWTALDMLVTREAWSWLAALGAEIINSASAVTVKLLTPVPAATAKLVKLTRSSTIVGASSTASTAAAAVAASVAASGRIRESLSSSTDLVSVMTREICCDT
mmetsp:Transcript_46986/g.124382  ORF Transcript_46986/g.124382 Transcript_46986/m.124382 type:complete len:200 (+) Transcript_46986:2252-2851(+)